MPRPIVCGLAQPEIGVFEHRQTLRNCYRTHMCFPKKFMLLLLLSCCAMPAAASENVSADANAQRGGEIYRSSCADCHGQDGQGVAEAYADPLIGDASLGELTKLISDTMPEGDAESCVGPDAAAVAKYIFDAFYSPRAQLRRNPPRVRLARLTATQLRQSLADIYGRFGEAVPFTEESGLKARYYNREQKDQRVEFDRVDQAINFDFGHDGPGQGIDAKDFSVTWHGALKIDVTGRYELIVRSSCAFVLYLGAYDREFINNYVQSENKTEFRKSLWLTAGRVYPLKIDFYQRKRKTEQPPARISLSWKPPYGTEEIVPSTALRNVHASPAFALQANLPPDDRSYGFERGINVDRQWDSATTNASIEFADQVIAELWPEYRKRNEDSGDANRSELRAFLRECVETAFRGPLNDEVQQLYLDDQIAASEDNAEAIKRVLLIALKSPRFLYPLLDEGRSDSQRAANRLALTLFDSLPSDAWLLDEIRGERLTEVHQVRDAAWRMATDWRIRGKTRQLLYEWMNLQHIDEITKDKDKFPNFDPPLANDLRKSFDAMLDAIVWSEESDFRQLLLADRSFTTPRMHAYYGDDWIATRDRDELQPSPMASDRSFGVLSHPYLMSGLAYRDSTSPIHRGVFLLRYVLGRTLRPPNEAFTPLSPDLHPDLTTRQRVELQTSPQNCQVCHAKINGLGFALENFDAVGRYRDQERGRAIDASGEYITRADELQRFGGPGELARFLAESEDVHRAFVQRAFQYFVKQPPAAFGLETEDELLTSFRENEFNIRKLLIEIAVVSATRYPSESTNQPTQTDPP